MSGEHDKETVLAAETKLRPLHNAVHTATQAWHHAFGRVFPRPLRDLDTWSHQTEAAYFEEPHFGRMGHRQVVYVLGELSTPDEAPLPPDKA